MEDISLRAYSSLVIREYCIAKWKIRQANKIAVETKRNIFQDLELNPRRPNLIYIFQRWRQPAGLSSPGWMILTGLASSVDGT